MIVPDCPPAPFPSPLVIAAATLSLAALVCGVAGFLVLKLIHTWREERLHKLHKEVVMKKLIVALALLAAVQAQAAPYFRPIDPVHAQKIIGASIDPVNPGKTSAISEVALITHSTKDGCLFPTVVCEDWSPLAVGPSYNAGKFAVVFGPVVNVAGAAKIGLKTLIRQFPEYEWKQGAIDALSLEDDSVTIAFGPQLWINPFRDGVVQPVNKWMPAGRLFAGVAVKF